MQIRHLSRPLDRASHLAAISATPPEVAACRRRAPALARGAGRVDSRGVPSTASVRRDHCVPKCPEPGQTVACYQR